MIAARGAVRDAAREAGLEHEDTERMALLASELAWNVVRHGRGGWLGWRPVERSGEPGLEIVAADRGDGITGLREALRGRASTAGGLGVGLAGVHRLADELDVDVRRGEGTCLRARGFAGRRGFRRREVGVFAGPAEGEAVNGDQAGFVRVHGWLSVAVIDGLGHGADARRPADVALGSWLEDPTSDPPDSIARADAALIGQRGGVMAALRVHQPTGRLDFAALGNIQARVAGRTGSRRLVGRDGFLGSSGRRRSRRHPMTLDLGAGDVIVMASDGLRTGVTLEREDLVPGEHPIVLAESLVERYARGHDDVVVLVAK